MTMLYWNHQYYQSEHHPFSIAGRAFQYGDGFFETLVFHNGSFPVWDLHWDRMLLGAKALGFELGSSEQWLDTIKDLLPKNIGTLRVRITAWRQGAGLYTPESDAFDWCLEYRALGHDWLQTIQPLNAVGIYPFPLLTPGPWSGFKSLSSMPYVLAGRHQKARHWDAVALLDHHSNIAEALGYNLFIIDGQSLKTPPLDAGIINGTLRRLLLKNNFGLEVKEQHLSQEEVCGASEVWLTNITFGIRTVAEFCGRTKGNSGLAHEIQSLLCKEMENL